VATREQVVVRFWIGLVVLSLAACRAQTPTSTPTASMTVTRVTRTVSVSVTSTLQSATATAVPATQTETATLRSTPLPSATASETPLPPPSATPTSSMTAPAPWIQTASPTASATAGAVSGGVAQPIFGPLQCCTVDNPAPLVEGQSLPADFMLSYEIICPTCGGVIHEGYNCSAPVLVQPGWIAGDSVVPGIAVKTADTTHYVQASSVTWSLARWPVLCNTPPVKVQVDSRAFSNLAAQEVTLIASAAFFDGIALLVTPPPTPAPRWYSANVQYQVNLP
jgi:hypothetical protein